MLIHGVRSTSTKMPKFARYDPYKLSVLQRAVLIPYMGIGALMDPTRGDLVAGLGDVTAMRSLKKLTANMKNSTAGRSLLTKKPFISTASLNPVELREMPPGSLGKEYIEFMDHHHFSADDRSLVRFMNDPDEAYVMTRYRQIHDFWHVLTKLPPTLVGEVALKVFEYRLTGLPVCALSGLLGQLKLSSQERSSLWNTYIPWALRAAQRTQAPNGDGGDVDSWLPLRGTSSHALMSYCYEDRDNLLKSTDQVRSELRLNPAPRLD